MRLYLNPKGIAGRRVGQGLKPPERPNVLFTALDDLNDWNTLDVRNNPIKTPRHEKQATQIQRLIHLGGLG